jgi:hypothetical protein
MRYMVPFFLIAVLASSAVLSTSSFAYRTLLALQGLGYLCAAFSWLLEKVGVRSRVLALPHYFVLANLASMIGLFKFLRGEHYASWEPIR